MWMSTHRTQTEGLLETQWRDHYTYEKESGSKLVFETPDNKTKAKEPGINVNEQEEDLMHYVDEEVQLSTLLQLLLSLNASFYLMHATAVVKIEHLPMCFEHLIVCLHACNSDILITVCCNPNVK